MENDNYIIHELYYGKIAPWEKQNKSTTQKFQVEKVLELQEKFISSLDNSGKKQFNNFLDENNELNSNLEEESFKNGFILGAKLILEILQNKSF